MQYKQRRNPWVGERGGVFGELSSHPKNVAE